MGRLRSFAQDLSGSTHDLTVTGPAAGGTGMSYSPSSQLLSQTRSNDAYAWTAHFNVNRPYGTNGLNQLTSAGASALAYDGRGNLTSDGTVSYGYTAENRLTTASGGKLLLYDPTGRLTRIDASGLVTRFEYLGPRLIAERDAGGAILRRYVHGPGDDEPLVWYEGSSLSDRRWLHADERGSVIAVSDASGNAINLYAYDEYGVPAPGNVGRFQYTGQVWLPELSLYYYKARIYSPTLGRFLQTDPIGYKDGINWYAYVGNDPVNETDSNGMCGPATPVCATAARCAASAPCRESVKRGVDVAVACARSAGCRAAVREAVVQGLKQAWNDVTKSPKELVDEAGPLATPPPSEMAGHRKRRPSTQEKHEEGDARRGRDKGGEKADPKRDPPRKRPPDKPKGPWPPKDKDKTK